MPSAARKPLSIGFEEIATDKIVRTELPDEPELADGEFDGEHPEGDGEIIA